MATVVDQHRANSPHAVRVAVLTVSDTRDQSTDSSGDRIVTLCQEAGHTVVDRALVADDADQIRGWVEKRRDHDDAEALILTGGTGISPRDVTIEAIEPLFTKSIPGFGELFRMFSHAEIGSASMLSRATAGLVGRLLVFALPGSRAGVDLAMRKVVLPELGHLVGQARKV